MYYKNLVRVLAETAQDWGVRVQSGENGLLNVALANGPERNWDFFDADAPPVLDGWITDLHLEPEDAKALMREMLYLYLRSGTATSSDPHNTVPDTFFKSGLRRCSPRDLRVLSRSQSILEI